ncbi:MAG: ATP-binding protein [Candidatus Merdivicinus sp.]|jgi:DNA polymerase-3 subunit delta'
MEFDSFCGNQAAVRILRTAAQGVPRSHAYLFYGTEGTGKKTLANLFAQALLCGGEEKPCGRCVACLKVLKGIHPDFTVVRKPADKSIISVEQIRALREEIFIRPNESDYRVVLLEEAENMNIPAANALLKVLEEPPSYVIFLLTAGNERLLPETIVSRCTSIELFEVPLTQAQKWIEEQFPAADPAERQKALLYGRGNLGKSRAYLEDAAVRRGWEQAFSLARALTARREYDILEALAPYENDKSGLLQLLRDFDNILGRIAVRPYSEVPDAEMDPLAGKISPLQAAALHNELDGVRTALFFNGNCALTAAKFGSRLKTIMETQA